ncbi:MAG: hypothetical protein RMJ28_04225 [Nitrososphaerota archaeon]|nr:hypothetical protein [Candidatus Calditenuaceae archaeon]MDW8073427.1 hypothetical protein [Nitrososphaerota archaeon]
MPRIIFRCRFCREERVAVVAVEKGEYLQVTCERGHTQFIRRREARLSGG